MGSQYSVYIARRKVKTSNEDKRGHDMKLRNGEVIKMTNHSFCVVQGGVEVWMRIDPLSVHVNS